MFKEERPNIIVFMTDQHRADCLGCYGNEVIRTPNIDRIAAEGVVFTHAYCQNPVCMPARATILTGTYPRTHGVWDNGSTFRYGGETLPSFFARNGYDTMAVGKIHVNPFEDAPEGYQFESIWHWKSTPAMFEWQGPYVGFQQIALVIGHVHYAHIAGHYAKYLKEEFPRGPDLLQPRCSREYLSLGIECWKNAIPSEHHYNNWIARQAIDFLRTHIKRPFFLLCSFPDPHFPFSAPKPYCDLYDPADVPLPACPASALNDKPPHYAKWAEGAPISATGHPQTQKGKLTEKVIRELIAQTYGMITHVDDCIGQVMAELERLNLSDRTIVIFTSDHGELLGDYGMITKGPFACQGLLRIPLIVRAQEKVGHRGAVSDALVGQVDLFCTLAELAGLVPPEYVQGVSLMPALADPNASLREALLTEYHPSWLSEPLPMKVLTTRRWQLVHYAGRRWGELYDLNSDPKQMRNLYGKPEYASVQQNLERQLLDQLVLTESEWPPSSGTA